MVLRSADCASTVIESASSRIISLYGGAVELVLTVVLAKFLILSLP
jgi:hypothetical protein